MKKLIRKGKCFKGMTVGLDLHKRFIEVAVLNRRGDQVEGTEIKSNEKELRELIERLEKKAPVQVVFEACGCFIWVYDYLVEKLGRERVHVAAPSQIPAIANGPDKNDANDAWWLAYLLHDRRLPEAHVSTGEIRRLKIATRELRAYTNMRSDMSRRIGAHLAQRGKIAPKAWHASKVKRKQMREMIHELKGESGEAVRHLYQQIVKMGREVGYWRNEIKRISAKFRDIQTMIDELPGLGLITAATVYGELGDCRRFKSEKAYAKATGLTPGHRTTAGKTKNIGITKAGSAQARWALTQSAMACLRCRKGAGARVKQWIVKRSQQNKPKKKVVVAAARKIAEGIWRLFKMGECFDLGKAFPGKSA